MLEDLFEWASASNLGSSVLWLHGPAGAGKSAIAQSLCQKLETHGRLGASFFFKRGHPSRGHAKKLFPTLAYQIAFALPELAPVISQAVVQNLSVLDRSLATQLQTLIIQPCRQTIPGRIFTIVIDGLDECEDPQVQQEVLRSIDHAIHEGSFPLRLLIASRPEPHIREIFLGALKRFHCLLNINQSFEDVRKYLRDEFNRIRREHSGTMAVIRLPWPSSKIINNLVEKSSGYFIYASTVIKFIDDKDFRPTERLAVIIGMAEPTFGAPFTALDQLYTQILSEIPIRPQLLKILAVIGAQLTLSAGHIEQLLELEPGDTRLVLRGLHSVINIPDKEDDGYWDGADGGLEEFLFLEQDIFPHHATFCDFLQDRTRAGIFYVDSSSHRVALCHDILNAFSYKHKDPSRHLRGHVAWYLDRRAFQCIASAEPTPDLVTQLHSFNPDFLFNHLYMDSNEIINLILNWLKTSQPLPEDSIQLWEDYRFMCHCDAKWSNHEEVRIARKSRDYYCQVLSQALPTLVKILQAVESIPLDGSSVLFKIHILLDLSWEELKTAICPLQSLAVHDREGCTTEPSVALNPTLFPAHLDSILWDLTCGSLRVILRILKGELERYMA
ncbi:hypothetical protein MVEN_00257400 [Mycena venus]|uniref:Nephrocystin 3-like N-terminal domain-containing protein n=1 Tax=Mycena venus TaxID=2733690 RepID=A0A8H7DF90_9AGAR|nr:hypothetical protein MVEN_00257400 [Mycena venus]